MTIRRGFTLIEILVVLAILSIITMFALPSPEPTIVRKQVSESVELIKDYQALVAFYHQSSHVLLKDNEAAGIPAPDKLLGNYVVRIELIDGAFHLHFGNKAHPAITNKILSVRPVTVKNSPASPLSWICGFSAVPEGMEAQTENKTTIEIKSLPLTCRI